MHCPRCGRESGRLTGLCDSCFAGSVAENAVPDGYSTFEKKDRKCSSCSSGKLVLIVIAMALAMTLFEARPANVSRAHVIDSAGERTPVCEPGESCVVAYLTPWCPACRSGLPLLRELDKREGVTFSAQFHLVIGQDDEKEITEMGEEALIPFYRDLDGSFARAARVSGYPTFLRIDKDGNVVSRAIGYPGLTDLDVEEQVLLQRLGFEVNE